MNKYFIMQILNGFPLVERGVEIVYDLPLLALALRVTFIKRDGEDCTNFHSVHDAHLRVKLQAKNRNIAEVGFQRSKKSLDFYEGTRSHCRDLTDTRTV